MVAKTLETLFHDTLRDIYYAERKIRKSLPKMARAAQTAELRAAFDKHREQTENNMAEGACKGGGGRRRRAGFLQDRCSAFRRRRGPDLFGPAGVVFSARKQRARNGAGSGGFRKPEDATMIIWALAASVLLDVTPESAVVPKVAVTAAARQEASPAPLLTVAVTLECTARADGRVENCRVLGETHPGLGFAEAAVALMQDAEVAPGPRAFQFARTIQFTP